MPESLSRFIEHAREKGLDHGTIFRLLESAGWKEKEIAEAVAARELRLPIPERAGIGSARDAFLHLFAFTAGYAATISLIVLVFAYIDFAFPDPVDRVSSYMIDSALSSIRWALATLIVSYPLFVAIWWWLLKEIRATPEAAKSSARRWLTSLSLFVLSVTILSDVITVVFYLVEGDITARFLLKVFALLLIAGSLFWYLSQTLRQEAAARQ